MNQFVVTSTAMSNLDGKRFRRDLVRIAPVWNCSVAFNYTRPITLEERHLHDDLGNCDRLLDPRHKALIEAGQYRRAGGDTVCSVCGVTYYSHPTVVGALWLKAGCGDFLLKL